MSPCRLLRVALDVLLRPAAPMLSHSTRHSSVPACEVGLTLFGGHRVRRLVPSD